MFTRCLVRSVISCLVLMSFVIPVVGGEKPVYVDGIDAAFPPFSYIDESGNPTGFDVEVVQWIADEMGFDVEIVPVDWDAIIPTLKAGNIDFIASGMTITQKRLEQVSFTIPYWKINLAVIVKEMTNEQGEPVPEFNTFSALSASRTVGVQRGTTSQTWIQENLIAEGVDINLKLYDSFLLAVEDLLIGRVDAAVMDEPTARSAVIGTDTRIVGTINTGEIYGYAVRKEDTEFLDLLNEGLQRIRVSEAWDQLVDKWFVEE